MSKNIISLLQEACHYYDIVQPEYSYEQVDEQVNEQVDEECVEQT